MAIRNIVQIGDPLLREICKPVTEFDDKLGRLLDDMKETMIRADGVGLAAPQVGILKRVCVVSPDDENFYEFVNPVITESSGQQSIIEGCLSVPNRRGAVARPQKITIEYQDRTGKNHVMKADDFLAIICCHEFDHLNGVLFVDRMNNDKL